MSKGSTTRVNKTSRFQPNLTNEGKTIQEKGLSGKVINFLILRTSHSSILFRSKSHKKKGKRLIISCKLQMEINDLS